MPLDWLMLMIAAVARTPLRVVTEASDDDQALVESIARGDRQSAVRLYDRLRPLVSRTIRRLSTNAADHDDLVQQAFIELFLSLRGRPVVRSLEGWAATIAARTVYQRLRRERLERRFAVPGGLESNDAEHAEAPESQPFTQASQRQAVQRVLNHLTELNENRVHVYVLHDVHGFELKEIAEILGITVANAQSRLVRGRADVRAKIESDEELIELLDKGAS